MPLTAATKLGAAVALPDAWSGGALAVGFCIGLLVHRSKSLQAVTRSLSLLLNTPLGVFVRRAALLLQASYIVRCAGAVVCCFRRRSPAAPQLVLPSPQPGRRRRERAGAGAWPAVLLVCQGHGPDAAP